MDWTEIKITVDTKDIDTAGDIANMVVPYGIYIEDYSDLEREAMEIAHIDLIDEDLLAKDRTKGIVHIYIDPQDHPQEAAAFLTERLAAAGIENEIDLTQCKNADWENNWKQYYQPLKVGSKLLVVPEWLHPENPEHRVEVLLDPGMIFGTGAHASTQMCMEELERAIQGGEEVLDLGSGSGILSITALLLGAAHATGVDIDPKAEDIARQNAAINQLGPDRFTALTGDVISDKAMMEKLKGSYDIVLANIVADVIIPLAPAAAGFLSEDSVFICSGILNTRLAEVLTALENAGMQILSTQQQDDWCRVTAALA